MIRSQTTRRVCALAPSVALVSLMAFTALAFPRHARADASQGMGSSGLFQMFLGTQAGEDASASCTNSSAPSGLLGMVNSIFCHLENDMGINGVGQATKAFSGPGPNGTTMTVAIKCDVTELAAQTYANQANCWVCSGAGCGTSSPDSAFNPLLSMQWTFNKGSVNKGTLIMDAGAFGGTAAQSGVNLKWDLSTTPSSPCTGGDGCVIGNVVFTGGSTQYPMALEMETNPSTDYRAAQIVGGASGSEMAVNMAENTSTNDVLLNFQFGSGGCAGGGMEGITGSTSPDSCTQCFTRTATATDWSYSTASSSSCGTLSLQNLPDTATTVSGFIVSDSSTSSSNIFYNSSGGGIFNGMGANPTF